jgi:hypothetical protein
VKQLAVIILIVYIRTWQISAYDSIQQGITNRCLQCSAIVVYSIQYTHTSMKLSDSVTHNTECTHLVLTVILESVSTVGVYVFSCSYVCVVCACITCSLHCDSAAFSSALGNSSRTASICYK